jgi:hypothetical protein
MPKHLVAAGWIAGFCTGTGIGAFAWWNPYLALAMVLGGLVMTATALIGVKADA